MDNDDDPETENPNPNPQAPADQPNPNPQAPAQDAPKESPFFVASTKEELDARLAPAKTEARVALAKSYGYDTIESFDTAMKAFKAAETANMSELERTKQELAGIKTRDAQNTARLNAQAVRSELEAQARTLGLNVERLDVIDELRPKNDGEVLDDGTANKDLLTASLQSVLTKFPEFKAKPATVGAGGNPAAAGAEALTIDQQIAAATSKGDWRTAINLENQKAKPIL